MAMRSASGMAASRAGTPDVVAGLRCWAAAARRIGCWLLGAAGLAVSPACELASLFWAAAGSAAKSRATAAPAISRMGVPAWPRLPEKLADHPRPANVDTRHPSRNLVLRSKFALRMVNAAAERWPCHPSTVLGCSARASIRWLIKENLVVLVRYDSGSVEATALVEKDRRAAEENGNIGGAIGLDPRAQIVGGSDAIKDHFYGCFPCRRDRGEAIAIVSDGCGFPRADLAE